MNEKTEAMMIIKDSNEELNAIINYLKNVSSLKRVIKNQLKLILIEMEQLIKLIKNNAETDDIINLTDNALSSLSFINKKIMILNTI